MAYLEWWASWWQEQGQRCKVDNEGTMLGLQAYVEKQAATLLALVRDSAIQWITALANKGIVPDWANHYNAIVTENSQTTLLTAEMEVDAMAEDNYEETENLDGPEDLDGQNDSRSVISLPSDFDIYDSDQ